MLDCLDQRAMRYPLVIKALGIGKTNLYGVAAAQSLERRWRLILAS